MYIIIFVAVIDGNNESLGLVAGCNEANKCPSPQWLHPLDIPSLVCHKGCQGQELHLYLDLYTGIYSDVYSHPFCDCLLPTSPVLKILLCLIVLVYSMLLFEENRSTTNPHTTLHQSLSLSILLSPSRQCISQSLCISIPRSTISPRCLNSHVGRTSKLLHQRCASAQSNIDLLAASLQQDQQSLAATDTAGQLSELRYRAGHIIFVYC